MLARPAAVARDSLTRNSILIMATTVATSGLGYLFWLVAARGLAPAQIGSATALISAGTVVSMVANLGIGHMFIQRLPGSVGADWSRIVSGGLLLGCAATAGAALTAAAVLPALAANFAFLGGAAGTVALLGTAVALTASTLLDHVFVAHRASHGMLWRNLALAAGKVLALLGLTAGGLNSAAAVLLAWTLPSFAVTAYTLRSGLPRLRPGWRLRIAGIGAEGPAVWRASTGHHLINLCQAGPSALLPVLVTARLGTADNAHFYVAWMTASVLFMVSPAVASAFYAERSNAERSNAERSNAERSNAQRSNAQRGNTQRGDAGRGDAGRDDAGPGSAATLPRAASVVLVVTAGPALLLLLGGGAILGLFGPQYAAGATLLQILVLAAIPDAITNLAVAHWRSLGAFRRCLRLNLLMAVTCLSLTWLWLPSGGIEAAGVAWLVGKGAGALVVGVAAGAAVLARRFTLRGRPRLIRETP